ncbi:MAG: Eco57I restriction-modification methylase domain-containing protein [Chthoniobacterales bacterium]
MSENVDHRSEIATALAGFEKSSLSDAARHLFEVLGYRSDRTLPIQNVAEFIDAFDPQNRVNATERSALDRLTSLRFLFQLTDTELTSQSDLLSDSGTVENTRIHSYLFFAAELPPGQYIRTVLSTLVRAINKPLLMPALILIRHGATISIGIIHRRLHKRDQAKDVLEKVTLIKDIDFADPIRAHLEILNDFVLDDLDAAFGTSNFVALHNAWQKRLGSYALSKDFYREIADWYFWAHHQVDDGTIKLPRHCDTEEEKSLFLIRLLTRVIFCWFLVEKRLLPPDIFRRKHLEKLLGDFSKGAHSYYQAVLQNLFFGTLNMPIEQRGFREKKKDNERYDKNRGITNLWRYGLLFRDYDKAKDFSPAWVALAARVPFLNGGLFDCLDDKTGRKPDNSILDGFSDNPNESCHLPNDLFFGAERTVDLSKDYGEEDKRTARSKRAKVRGLIEILARYKFTIEENTPLEEEIALDPELLGKVFENLLASYNEDTRTTARRALGAFYTPREIVSYMVDEALRSYLSTQVPAVPEKALRELFSAKATPPEIKPAQREALVAAIGRVKILDPACGSGAFPMGALHRLVDLLQKLDPNNESWKRDRLTEARRYRELLDEAGADKEEIADCDSRIADIEKSFNTRFHALDFARKLYLIENCIYGVDIQPIATQIAKLRFFISLIVDQKVDATAPNLGVRPLPNLETRVVAADSLIPIEREAGGNTTDLFSADINRLRDDLARIRHEHFNARDPRKKAAWREADAAKRQELANLLKFEQGLPKDAAKKLAEWDPYDQNDYAPFFDPEWMFGLRKAHAAPDFGDDRRFDIAISNPPYRKERDSKALFDRIAATQWGSRYKEGKMDMWFHFMHRAIDLVRNQGTIVFITSRYWIESSGAKKLIHRMAAEVMPIDVIDIGKLTVFDNVAGHHMVHSYCRGCSARKITVKRLVDDLSGLNSTKSGPAVEVFARNSADLFAEDGRVRLYAARLDLSPNPRLGETYLVSQGVVQNPDKVNRKNAERFDLPTGAGVFVLSAFELDSLGLSRAELEFVKPFLMRRMFAVST